MGLNITNNGLFSKSDFIELKAKLRNEFSRRSMTLPTGDTYTNEPDIGIKVFVEHPQKVFDDEHLFNSSKNHSTSQGGIVLTSGLSETIFYIQTLMSTNIRS
ncbi:hypothetical protein [Dehalobacter sp. TBBPA1]|uniref:hypothetical protein n=1 Tax=Dehalobacter sp. TBBPA1 TaxID=3235037 RepID=UPI0034A2BD7A